MLVRRPLLLIATACLVAAPPAADAAVRHVVRGAGWGHGIGMSQYGAYGYALEGRGYRAILGHYYGHTRLTSAPSRPVRVLLQPNDPYIRFRGASSANGRRLRPGRMYIARRSGARIALRTLAGDLVARFRSPLRVESPGEPLRLMGPALNGVGSGLYRGAIEIHVDAGLTAINVVELDPYVKGVVPGEMPSSWPLEALRAQAVAARTYALATRKSDGIFDQYPDTRSQVYRGVTGEAVRSSAAVDATAGEILTYAGEPAVTYFFSTSGGHTENVENVFLGSLSRPWLVGVPDPYDHHSPYHRWRVRFTTRALNAALGSYVAGSFRRLKAIERGASPRIVRARIHGTRGSTTISGPTLRARLGLRDTWACFFRVSTSARRARSARPASWGGRPLSPVLSGSFEPRRPRLRLERRAGPRWRFVTFVRTGRGGHYRVAIDRAGRYRVRSGAVAGPAVSVR